MVWFEGVIIVLSTVYFLISLNLRPVQTYESRLQAGSVSDVPGYVSIWRI